MNKLIQIIAKLRSPEGCPWDRKQTHKSLSQYTLEEAWEVIDEIEQGNTGDSLKEELGDLLLQIVLHAQIAAEDQRFTFADVVDAISAKMIRRHPHVFQSDTADISEAELRKQWNAIKAEEKNGGSTRGSNTDSSKAPTDGPTPCVSIKDSIPASAPALLNALTIGKKAGGMGFDWETSWDVLSKVEEELEEVRQEMKSGNVAGIEEELGDLLFTLTNLARFYKINPEIALKKGNDKFMKRFYTIEQAMAAAEKGGGSVSREEMESLWNKAK